MSGGPGMLAGVGTAVVGAAVGANQMLGGHNLQGVTTAAAGLGTAMMAVGGALGPFGAAIVAGTVVVKAFAAVTETVVHRAKEIGRYSPAISQELAVARVRDIQGDIREAQQLGPGMARVISAQSKMESDLREMLLPIKRFLIETLASFLEAVSKVIDWIADGVIATSEGVATLGAIVRDAFSDWGKLEEDIMGLPDRIAKAQEARKKRRDLKGVDLFVNQMYGMLNPHGKASTRADKEKFLNDAARFGLGRVPLPGFALGAGGAF
jgi:hypothetical protein